MAEKFIGKWQNYENEKLDDYFKAMGVGFAVRKIAGAQKPLVEYIKEGDQWKIITKSTVKTTEMKFKMGESFADKDISGKEATSKFYVDGDKLVKEMTVGPLKTLQSRQLVDGILVITMTVGDVTATMKFKKA